MAIDTISLREMRYFASCEYLQRPTWLAQNKSRNSYTLRSAFFFLMFLRNSGGVGGSRRYRTYITYTDFVEKSKRNEVRSGVEYYLFEIMEPSCLMEPSWVDCVCSCLALAFSSVTHSHWVGGNTAYMGNIGASSYHILLTPTCISSDGGSDPRS